DELYKALKGSKSEFRGSFYHCSTATEAPNPGLEIDGLGVIGLPLSQRDAAAIVSCAAQAPFRKGMETVVDTAVRDTWEIEPASVKFSNPKWAAFVDQVATQTVWMALGVAPFTKRLRCELYKLLLYQPSGHTLKSNGMFATIIIVLPSLFGGAEVHVSHAGQTKVLDISEYSAFSTSILAWYIDVMHEVKPVTSGYRLALSYNLIHTSPNMPQPALPKHSMISTPLGQCLQKWKNGGFARMPDPPLAAYVLDHQYSANNLEKGQEGLKGKDTQLVAQLLLLAESLSFIVGIANLTRKVTGSADDGGYNHSRYNKRRRYGHCAYDSLEDDSEETHTFADIEEDDYDLENFVRLDKGECEEDVDLDDFRLDKGCLVPRNPFDHVGPDEEEYEGYMGNVSLPLWYRRSVLILFRIEDAIAVGISINGVDWALDQLYAYSDTEDEDHPTARFIVSALLTRLEKKHNPRTAYWSNEDIETNQRCAKNLLARAIEWKNQALWSRVIPHCGPALDTVNTSIVEAVEVFDLEAIKPGYATRLATAGLQTRFAVIKAIAGKIGAAGGDWLESLTKDALSSYNAAAVADIPTLVEIAQSRGPEVIQTSIYNLVYKDATYASLINFAKALHTGLPKVLSMEEGKRSSIRVVIGKSIEAAIPKWEVRLHIPGPANPGYTYSYGYRAAPSVPTPVDPRAPNVKTNRICELVDLSFALDDLGICTALFNELLRLPSGVDADTRFKEVFTPLMPQLRATLLKHGRAVTSEPFASFFKHSVSMYLAHILGPRTPKTITPSLPTRTAGCNTCNECKQLKAFVNNGTPTLQFRAVQRTRTHLEQEIAKARIGDIVTTAMVTNLGTPYTLVVSKRPEVISQLTWKENQSEAVKFVRSVADDAELKVVMG
ncbi:hypothetical protein FA13DRAFT_1584402, partial [Coprinellus micaceus]